MERCFIDTNVFLRLLIKENRFSFNDCLRFFEAVKKNKIKGVTSTLVLAEIVWTLTSYYNFSKKEAARAVKGVVNLRGLKLVDEIEIDLALELFSGRPVKFIDALIASNKKIFSGEWLVVSYDKDFDKLGVIRKEPGEVV